MVPSGDSKGDVGRTTRMHVGKRNDDSLIVEVRVHSDNESNDIRIRWVGILTFIVGAFPSCVRLALLSRKEGSGLFFRYLDYR
jgi:hypothetical protein